MTYTARNIEDLKADGLYFDAGKLARQLGHDRGYGCHYGFKSDRARAIAEFEAGFDAEDTVAVWPRGYAHEDGTSNIKVPAGTDEETIRRQVRLYFGPYASISGITRAYAPSASVSDEDARYYTRHDNS